MFFSERRTNENREDGGCEESGVLWVQLHFFDSGTLLNKLNGVSSPLISKLVCSSSSYCVDRFSQ